MFTETRVFRSVGWKPGGVQIPEINVPLHGRTAVVGRFVPRSEGDDANMDSSPPIEHNWGIPAYDSRVSSAAAEVRVGTAGRSPLGESVSRNTKQPSATLEAGRPRSSRRRTRR